MTLEPSYRYWIYDYQHPNMESVIYHLDSLLRKFSRLKLNIVIVHSVRPLNDLVEESVPEGFQRKLEGDKSTGIFTLRLTRTTLDGEISEDVRLIRANEDQTYFAISDFVTGRTNEVLIPFLNSYYPDISRVYYSSFELYYLLRALQKKVPQSTIVVHRTTELQGIGRRRRRINVAYTYEQYQTIFDRLYEQRIWINKVLISLRNAEDSVLLKAYLSKDGRFRCSSSFRTFYEAVIQEAARLAEKKKRAFSQRNRTADRPQPQIMQLTYDYDLFDKDQLLQFSDVLSSFPFSSISVFHRNPYFHASVVDRLDGSSYDLWIVSPNKIHLVPQIRANAASIARLVNHLFENFREGETEGYVGPLSIS